MGAAVMVGAMVGVALAPGILHADKNSAAIKIKLPVINILLAVRFITIMLLQKTWNAD
jgi:hypothetical protein